MKLKEKTSKWIKENKREAIVIAIILIVGAILRFYKIDEYMTFLGDEGRDAIIVRRLLVDFDPILIGPGTSIGNMYLGPLYYYMMAPALLLANFSPVGPAVMIAILSVITIWMVYYMARVWFPSEKGRVNVIALSSAWLYAMAPTVIIYSRSSWNPNIMPFFALISIFSIWKVWMDKNYKWMVVLGFSLIGVIQSHYLGLILFSVVGIFWLASLVNSLFEKKDKETVFKKFSAYSLVSAVIFLVLMSPLLIFDMRHGWINYNSMTKFFTERQTTVSAKPWSSIPKLGEVSSEIGSSLLTARETDYGGLLLAMFSLVAIWYVVHLIKLIIAKRKGQKTTRLLPRIWNAINDRNLAPYLVLVVWIGMAFVGLGVYKQEIYEHYYGFIFAAPFLLLASLLYIFIKNRWSVGLVATIVVVTALSVLAIQNSPVKYPPNKQYTRSVSVSEKMIEEAGGEKFNIAVIAERNYEGAYQYHLERVGAPFVIIDPQRADDTITTQLFVACELPSDECDPVHNDKAEVANFGWSKVENEWNVSGVTLYKLVKNEEGIPQ